MAQTNLQIFLNNILNKNDRNPTKIIIKFQLLKWINNNGGFIRKRGLNSNVNSP